MARNYDLDMKAASAADGGNYISETGKYIGTFTRAEAVTSQKGTEGVEFTFKADNEASADFLSLWTHSKDGKELPSFKALNAILTCLKLRGIKSQEGRVEKYDQATKARAIQSATIYPDLMNKPIGVLLQKVWRADKPDKYKFEIVGVFEASTELTASEILDKASAPSRLAKMVLNLKDKHESAHPAMNASNPSNSDPEFDEFRDIPF